MFLVYDGSSIWFQTTDDATNVYARQICDSGWLVFRFEVTLTGTQYYMWNRHKVWTPIDTLNH